MLDGLTETGLATPQVAPRRHVRCGRFPNGCCCAVETRRQRYGLIQGYEAYPPNIRPIAGCGPRELPARRLQQSFLLVVIKQATVPPSHEPYRFTILAPSQVFRMAVTFQWLAQGVFASHLSNGFTGFKGCSAPSDLRIAGQLAKHLLQDGAAKLCRQSDDGASFRRDVPTHGELDQVCSTIGLPWSSNLSHGQTRRSRSVQQPRTWRYRTLDSLRIVGHPLDIFGGGSRFWRKQRHCSDGPLLR